MNNSGGNLVQVVRRYVGSHTHCDTRRTVDEEVGKLGRQHRRLLEAIVEIRHIADGVLLDVFEHLDRQPRETGLSVPVGCRIISVYRSEVSLTVHQRIPQRKDLYHSNQRIVDG